MVLKLDDEGNFRVRGRVEDELADRHEAGIVSDYLDGGLEKSVQNASQAQAILRSHTEHKAEYMRDPEAYRRKYQ